MKRLLGILLCITLIAYGQPSWDEWVSKHGFEQEEQAAAQVVQETRFGFTPLWVAVYRNDIAAVKNLLTHDSDVCHILVPCPVLTPVHVAAAHGSAELVGLLCKQLPLADIHKLELHSGVPSPLHMAAAHGNVQAIPVLLAHGFSREALDPRGRTALQVAQVFGLQSVVGLLAQAPTSPLAVAPPVYVTKQPSPLVSADSLKTPPAPTAPPRANSAAAAGAVVASPRGMWASYNPLIGS